MRTAEQQQQNLDIARAYYAYNVSEAIRQSNANAADKETMRRIVNARYNKDSWAMYLEADTAVRDCLMDIIEEAVYGKKLEQPELPEQRAVTLTEDEWTELTTYILITTKHRVSEAEAWEKLATEKCPDGSPRFPKAADNALFWREMSAKLERIRKQIDR